MSECQFNLKFWNTDLFVLRGTDWEAIKTHSSPFQKLQHGPYWLPAKCDCGKKARFGVILTKEGLRSDNTRELLN